MCGLWSGYLFRLPHLVLRGVVLSMVWRLPRVSFVFEKISSERSLCTNRSRASDKLATVCCRTQSCSYMILPVNGRVKTQ